MRQTRKRGRKILLAVYNDNGMAGAGQSLLLDNLKKQIKLARLFCSIDKKRERAMRHHSGILSWFME